MHLHDLTAFATNYSPESTQAPAEPGAVAIGATIPSRSNLTVEFYE